MTTRREFLTHSTAAGIVIATPASLARAAQDGGLSTRPSAPRTEPHRRQRSRIESAIRREETTLRLGGMGDNFHMTWAADDRQLVAVCDGLGWIANPKDYYNSRLYAINGGPLDATFEEVQGYPELTGILGTPNIQRYYGFGTISLGKYIYQFLSTPNHQFTRDDFSPWLGARFVGAKLIYSPDGGRTWCNQDGSSPVIWEPWEHRTKQNMLFFEEEQDAFSLLSVLQMGRNYTANQDGYVYVYAPNGNTDGTMNQIVLFRVPKHSVLNRKEYRYFGGLQRDGRARWVNDIRGRAVVHTFPGGWVNTSIHPWAWMPSVTYNAPLDLYMMANWGMGCAPDGSWFGKPSYLGLWVAQKPWGPWLQVYEDTAWMPQGDREARSFAPQISPKWISEDGRSLWIVWADFKKTASDADFERLVKDDGARASTSDGTVRFFQKVATMMPFYAFNTQRIDLVIT